MADNIRTAIEEKVLPLRRHAQHAHAQEFNTIATVIVEATMVMYEGLKAELLHTPIEEVEDKPRGKK